MSLEALAILNGGAMFALAGLLALRTARLRRLERQVSELKG